LIRKDLQKCDEFIAGDGSVLREILNPGKEQLTIGYSLAHARIFPGKRTIAHRLKSSEVYYIIEGRGEMYIDGELEEVVSGQAVYIPPDSVQWIENTADGDLVFLCIVDPAWKAEDEEIISSP
jgi:mannose-6-phosphate isomerase-like protein (cupin superfamily)